MAAKLIGGTFPWGTLIVNIVGSLVIGFVATLAGPDGRFLASTTAGQFLMVGVLGGYTTFSAFSLQTLNLLQQGQWPYACLYILASVLLCLLAVWIGHVAAVHFNAFKWA